MDAVIWNIAGTFFVAFGILLFILLPFTPEEGASDILGFAVFFSLLGIIVIILNKITSWRKRNVKEQPSNQGD